MAVVPIHAYEFDSDVSDSAGSANGTLLGGASVSGGRLTLDGSNDYVQFDSLLVPSTGAYSVFIRLNGTPNPSGFTEIISQGLSGSEGFYIGTAPGGTIRLTDRIGGTGVMFPLGEAELLFSTSGAGSSLYVNGSLAFSSGVRGGFGTGGSNTRFGRQFGGLNEYFAGSIDSIRIYDSVIVPGDVVEPMLAVPEPASWAMLIAGFGLTGAVMRRRRTVTA